MEFEPFDTSKLDAYAEQAKASWGKTPQWREYEEKWAGRSKGEQVAKIRTFITENCYACTNEILARLGRVYGAGGDFTQNINAAAVSGAAWPTPSEEERAAALPSFLERYNWARPHSACGGLPPMSHIVGVNNAMAHNR